MLQPADGGLRIADDRPAGGHQEVRFFGGDPVEAGHEFAQAPRPAMIAADLGLANGVLQAEQVLQLSVIADEIAGERDLPAAKFDQVADGAAGVTRRVEHPD